MAGGTDYASELLAPTPQAAARDLLRGDAARRSAPAATDYASELIEPKAVTAVKLKGRREAGAPTDAEYYGGVRQAATDIAVDLPGHVMRAAMGFIKGVTDIPVGLAQLISKLGPDSVDQAVAQWIREQEANYQSTRGEYANDPDLGRVTGTVVTSLPVGGTAAAPTVLGRAVQGGKVGAVLGATTTVDPDAEDFALRKAAQVVGGAVTGALAVPVVEVAIKAAGATANAVANFIRGAPNRLTNKATQDAVEQTLTAELKREGVNWADLSKAARDSLILETQKALKTGGTIDTEAVRRIADFQKLGIEPTRGQVTRDPNQFSFERNIGKTEVGAPLAQRFNEQNTQLIGAVDRARQATGGAASDAYDAGRSAQAGLKSADAVEKARVDRAYTAARDDLGRASPMDAADFSRKANLSLDEGMLGHYLPAEVRGILNDVSAGKIPLNVDTAVKIDQTLSAAQRAAGNGTPQALAIGKVRDALNTTPIESAAGEAAKAAFDAARGQAKARFEKIESIPALADALKNRQVAPEDFVETYVIRGGVDELKNTMAALPTGARRDVRASVVDWLKSKAVSGADETATFSQANYNRALDTIGARNLRTIFEDPNAVEQLRRIGRVAANVQKAPVSSGVNYSSSATTLIDMLDKVSRISGALPKGGDIVRATAVTRSLQPAAPVKEPPPFLTMDQLDALSRTGSVVAPATGATLLLGP